MKITNGVLSDVSNIDIVDGEFKIPEGVTSIGNYAFCWCESLTSIKIPEGVTSIGNDAFYGCKSLTSIKIPEGVTSIGNYAFYGCKSLTSLAIKKHKRNEIYKVMCADGYIAIVDKSRDVNGDTAVHTCRQFNGMKNKKLLTTDCFIAERNGIYAHGDSIKNAIADLKFKLAKDRGAEQYRKLTKESKVSYEDAIIMYRIITGACQFGTNEFLKTVNEKKDEYTVKEMIDITAGQYGSGTFAKYFEKV